MKNLWIFGAAAVLSLAACSKNIEPADPGASGTKGDMFMTLAIQPTGTVGTRTATPNQTQGEVGKDRENKISNALIVFAKQGASEGNYTVVTSVYTGGSDNAADASITTSVDGSKAVANFKVDRNTVLKAISGSDTPAESGTATFYIFVLANPKGDLITAFTPNSDVQQVFATVGDASTYWTADNFLMTNAELYEKEINAAEIQPGSHTESSNPYSLNKNEAPLKIQRAMSRFDLAVSSEYTKFTATLEGRGEGDNLSAPNSDIQDITLEFDAVALVNMATSANAFKVTVANEDAYNGKTIAFGTENATNWVWSPKQTTFSAPLFDGPVTDGKLTGSSNALESFFANAAPETTPYAVNRVGGYTLISNLRGDANGEADNDYQRPSDAATDQPEYYIWRYAMENTNPFDADKQVNGNSTGVVFRAKITGNKVDGTEIKGETDGPLYAYGNVILGNAAGLKTYATSPKDRNDNANIYDAVKLKYDAAVQKALDANKNEASNGTWTFDDGYKSTVDGTDWFETKAADFDESGKYEIHYGTLSDLDVDLVASGFTIYRPENNTKNYYCYYIYWNRHNDNGNNSKMAPMEFATVRNNVYKLRVNKIHKLGHPGKPEDDPDDPTPDTPDEKDSFYCEIICEILPWEVRINGIEF